jgi:hypothetical protein
LNFHVGKLIARMPLLDTAGPRLLGPAHHEYGPVEKTSGSVVVNYFRIGHFEKTTHKCHTITKGVFIRKRMKDWRKLSIKGVGQCLINIYQFFYW